MNRTEFGIRSCELLSNHYLCAKKNSNPATNVAAGISCELLSNHYLCAKKNSHYSVCYCLCSL